MSQLLKEIGLAILEALKREMIERLARVLAEKIEALWRRLRDWLADRRRGDEAAQTV
jgi:hypothetical protein